MFSLSGLMSIVWNHNIVVQFFTELGTKKLLYMSVHVTELFLLIK